MNIKYKDIIKKIDILNKNISDTNEVDYNDEYIEEYSNARNKEKYFFIDQEKDLKEDIINYKKLVKNNIALANIILQKLG